MHTLELVHDLVKTLSIGCEDKEFHRSSDHCVDVAAVLYVLLTHTAVGTNPDRDPPDEL
jgi:hypothetical protein